jgi:hypothetical protein
MQSTHLGNEDLSLSKILVMRLCEALSKVMRSYRGHVTFNRLLTVTVIWTQHPRMMRKLRGGKTMRLYARDKGYYLESIRNFYTTVDSRGQTTTRGACDWSIDAPKPESQRTTLTMLTTILVRRLRRLDRRCFHCTHGLKIDEQRPSSHQGL